MPKRTSKKVTRLEPVSKLSEKTKQTSASMLNINQTAPKAVEPTGGMVDGVLGKIYQLMVDIRKDELDQRKKDEITHQTDLKTEETRHQELLKALSLRRRPQPKRVIRRERKAEEKEAKKAPEPTKPTEPAKKPTEPVKKPEPTKPAEAPKPAAPKPAAPKPAAPKPETPKPAAPKPEAPKPAAPKPEAPKPAAPKPEAPKPAAPKPEAPKPAAPKPAEVKPPPKAEPVKPPEVKPPPKAEPVKPPEVKPPPKAEAAPTAPKPAAPSTVISTAAKIAVTATGVFATADAFSKTMMPYAEKASKALGGKIPPVAILGQWAGESSSGKSVSAPFNYAGIKAGKNDKKGDYVLTEERYTDAQIKQATAAGETLHKVLGPTDTITKKGRQVTIDEWFGKGSIAKAATEGKKWVQVKSYFAKFDNFEEFTNRYVQFLSSDRYKKARESTDAGQFGLEVAKAGYATASADKYSQHIAEYAKNYNTGDKLDQSSKENAELKEKLNKDKSTQTTNNTTTTTNQTTNVKPEQRVDDRPPHIRKQQQ